MDERNTGSFHLTGAGQSGGVSAPLNSKHVLVRYVEAVCSVIEKKYLAGELDGAYDLMNRLEKLLGIADPTTGEREYRSWDCVK